MNALIVPISALPPLEVYYDDTGRHSDADVFMWAGYIATQANWNVFRKRWNEALASEPTPLAYWHTSKARARASGTPFSGLDRGAIIEKERSLCEVIAKCGNHLTAMVVRLPLRYHAEIVKGKIAVMRELPTAVKAELPIDKLNRFLERPDAVALQHGIVLAAVIAGRGRPPVPVHFMYEKLSDAQFEENFEESIEALRYSLPPQRAQLVGRLTGVPGKSPESAPLQAADLLAWHLTDRSRRKGADDPNWRILEKTPANEVRIGRPELERFVAGWNSSVPIDLFID